MPGERLVGRAKGKSGESVTMGGGKEVGGEGGEKKERSSLLADVRRKGGGKVQRGYAGKGEKGAPIRVATFSMLDLASALTSVQILPCNR